MKKIALVGAGGKMGCRITKKIKDNEKYDVSYIEINSEGIDRLKDLGVSVTPEDEALSYADITILAVPDKIIKKVSKKIVAKIKTNSIVIGLDPAAAYADVLPNREDITYFIVHPCHPPLFHDETEPEALVDWFGGTAKQDIVCALYQGSEDQYKFCENLSKDMFGPIRNSYRITIDQMVILEPALVETFTSTLVVAMKEAFEEVVKMGVPREAARGFLMGHLRVQFAVIFGYADFPFSDANYEAINEAMDNIFQPDWKEKVFKLENIEESVKKITKSISK